MALYNFSAIGRTCLKILNNRMLGSSTNPKTAVVMINMGGPSTTDQVHDYLLRIMTDRDMIQLPLMQNQLGPWIAKRRTPEVQKKYEEIGGGSPIGKWTKLQGDLLCKELDKVSPETAPHKPYTAFRYVQPFTEDALAELEKDGVERAILFSQYPQYSCATTGSSLNAIYKYYKKRNFPKNLKLSLIDRWPTHHLLAKTFADLIRKELAHFPEDKRNDVVLLFSAHSLPLKEVDRFGHGSVIFLAGISIDNRTDLVVVPGRLNAMNYIENILEDHVVPAAYADQSTENPTVIDTMTAVNRGDSYPSEVSATALAVMQELGYSNPHQICWQSKVGPLPWLGPFTDDALRDFVKQGVKNFVMIPIAFVNEHIETLHEMDIEYCKELAEEIGVEQIRRVPAPNDHPLFIQALTELVKPHLSGNSTITKKFLTRCPHCVNMNCVQSKKWFAEVCK